MLLSQKFAIAVPEFPMGHSSGGPWASFAFLGGGLPVGTEWRPWDPVLAGQEGGYDIQTCCQIPHTARLFLE